MKADIKKSTREREKKKDTQKKGKSARRARQSKKVTCYFEFVNIHTCMRRIINIIIYVFIVRFSISQKLLYGSIYLSLFCVLHTLRQGKEKTLFNSYIK